MGLFDFLKPKKETASIARDRLRIIVAQERTTRGAPDYLPMLQRELLEVIKKYVNVDADAVNVKLIKEGEHDVLDISVSLQEGARLIPAQERAVRATLPAAATRMHPMPPPCRTTPDADVLRVGDLPLDDLAAASLAGHATALAAVSTTARPSPAASGATPKPA